MASVQGDDAKRFNAVRLDSFANVNTGELVEADELTGKIVWTDSTGNKREVTLGSHAIKLVPARR